jgi:uncharacterized membrane protein
VILFAALFVAGAVASSAAPHAWQDARATELAREVERILETKCTECHVPESKNAKARKKFDTARDLARVVEDWVAAGDLELSDLWLQVEDGTMPPEEAANGPLTVGEKEVVRSWILAGAPVPPADGAGAGTTVETTKTPPPRRWLVFAGHLHPSLVHFPIGLLLAAGLTELFVLARASHRLLATSLGLVRLAACFAPLAAVAGWINALDATPDRSLELHRWAGVTTAVLAVLLLPFSERAFSSQRRGSYRLLLFLACAAVALAGHLGGRLVYGTDYLSL